MAATRNAPGNHKFSAPRRGDDRIIYVRTQEADQVMVRGAVAQPRMGRQEKAAMRQAGAKPGCLSAERLTPKPDLDYKTGHGGRQQKGGSHRRAER